MAVGDDWSAVAEAVRERLGVLGMTLKEFHRESGISDTTMRAILRGQPIVRVDKRRQLCDGLGWTRDSIERILRGEPPVVIGVADNVDVLERMAVLEARIDQLEAASKTAKKTRAR